MSGSRYGRLIADCQRRALPDEVCTLDRVDLADGTRAMDSNVYTNNLPLESLDHPESLKTYDMIFIADLFENLDNATGWRLLHALSEKVSQRVLIFCEGDPRVVFGKTPEEYRHMDIRCQSIDAMPNPIWLYTAAPISAAQPKGGLSC